MNKSSHFGLLWIINIYIFISFQYLFEIGYLETLFGYTDWNLYRRYLLDQYEINGPFYDFLSIFKYFPSNPQYYIYFIIDIFWPFWFARMQLFYFSRSKFIYFFIIMNPMIFLMFAGIFKESILFIFLILGLKFYKKYPFYFLKINIIFTLFLIPILYVRPHLFAVFFALSKYSIFFIVFMSCAFVAIIIELGFFDFKFIERSILSLQDKGYADINLFVIKGAEDIIFLPVNIFLFTCYFIFSNNIIFTIYGLIQFLSGIRLLQITEKHLRSKVILFFASLVLIYSFLVVVSGTAFRLISVAWFLTALLVFILNYIKPKLEKNIE